MYNLPLGEEFECEETKSFGFENNEAYSDPITEPQFRVAITNYVIPVVVAESRRFWSKFRFPVPSVRHPRSMVAQNILSWATCFRNEKKISESFKTLLVTSLWFFFFKSTQLKNLQTFKIIGTFILYALKFGNNGMEWKDVGRKRRRRRRWEQKNVGLEDEIQRHDSSSSIPVTGS